MKKTRFKYPSKEEIMDMVRKRKFYWLGKQEFTLHHIHYHSFVIGYAAPKCIVIAEPWMESEDHMKDFKRQSPLLTTNDFDPSLKPNDWCITVYVATETSGHPVALEYKETK